MDSVGCRTNLVLRHRRSQDPSARDTVPCAFFPFALPILILTVAATLPLVLPLVVVAAVAALLRGTWLGMRAAGRGIRRHWPSRTRRRHTTDRSRSSGRQLHPRPLG